MNQKGFSLIELMVGISIIGILMALTLTGISSSRAAARDAKRKADLELIRSGLEIYKSDCDNYPVATYTTNWPSQIIGDGSPASCAVANVYIAAVPIDPVNTRYYRYSSNGTTYGICAFLEQGSGSVSCGGSSTCGTGTTCNYKVTNP